MFGINAYPISTGAALPSPASAGQVLTANADGTYSWATVPATAPGAWIAVTAASGWTSSAFARLNAGRIEFYGSLTAGSLPAATSTTIATAPAGARPSIDRQGGFTIGNPNSTMMRIIIASAGTMLAVSPSGSSVVTTIYLDGLSVPA